MKTAVIGGTGHIGSFLTRMLAEDGHEVLALSTGRTTSHVKTDPNAVRFVTMRYSEMLQSGEFASLLRDERVDAVVDILQGDTHGVYTDKSGRYTFWPPLFKDWRRDAQMAPLPDWPWRVQIAP